MFLVFYALLNEFYTYNRYDEFDMILTLREFLF